MEDAALAKQDIETGDEGTSRADRTSDYMPLDVARITRHAFFVVCVAQTALWAGLLYMLMPVLVLMPDEVQRAAVGVVVALELGVTLAILGQLAIETDAVRARAWLRVPIKTFVMPNHIMARVVAYYVIRTHEWMYKRGRAPDA